MIIYNPDEIKGWFLVVKDGDAQNSVELLIIVTVSFTLIFVINPCRVQLEKTALFTFK